MNLTICLCQFHNNQMVYTKVYILCQWSYAVNLYIHFVYFILKDVPHDSSFQLELVLHRCGNNVNVDCLCLP